MMAEGVPQCFCIFYHAASRFQWCIQPFMWIECYGIRFLQSFKKCVIFRKPCSRDPIGAIYMKPEVILSADSGNFCQRIYGPSADTLSEMNQAASL